MDIIREIINEWDPMDLLANGYPEDEYSSEIRRVRHFFENNIVTKEMAAKRIRKIFESSFYPQSFECSEEECVSVALQLLEVDWEKEISKRPPEKYLTEEQLNDKEFLEQKGKELRRDGFVVKTSQEMEEALKEQNKFLVNSMYNEKSIKVDIAESKDHSGTVISELIKEYPTLQLKEEKQVYKDTLTEVNGDGSPLSYMEAAMLYNDLSDDSDINNSMIIKSYEQEELKIDGAIYYVSKDGNPVVEYAVCIKSTEKRTIFKTVICVFSSEGYEMKRVMRPLMESYTMDVNDDLE